MAKKNKQKNQQAEADRELTRKEQRLHAREREEHRKLYLGIGVAIALVVVVLAFGLISEFLVKPNSTIATVGEDKIVTREFWKRVRFEERQLQSQYARLFQLEQQFGGQGFFTNQLNQIQATLASPFSLGVQVLDNMVSERLVAQEAAERSIVVDEALVEEALRNEIAAAQNAVTAPQATETAEAAVTATAVAAEWTPTPVPTISVSNTVTTTETVPTLEPAPTLQLLTDDLYQEGLTNLTENLQDVADLDLDEYRSIIRARLLSERLAEELGEELVPPTEEQINARHILVRIDPPAPEPDPNAEPTPTATPLPEGFPTPAPTPEPRDALAAKILIDELQQRLLNGEDFADLAAEYSDDLSNAGDGGDLGWFGRGAMVGPFEEVAFALAVGEVSEPVETQFGWHLIELVERDEAREKDENTLAQERQRAYQDWILEKTVAADVERPDDLTSLLPRGIGQEEQAAPPDGQPIPQSVP